MSEQAKNGEGEAGSYLLVFDRTKDAEERAWQMTRKLAAQRRLKHTLLGFLLALDEIRERTGKDHSVEEMMASFISSMSMDRQQNSAYAQPSLPPLGDLSEDIPALIVGSADHVDPDEARDQLALGMGDLFGDD